MPEVDRVGAGDPRAVEGVGVEHLDGHGLPAARGPSVGESRPALPEASEPSLDLGHQLEHDRVAVRPVVRRVHRVRVVVERCRVLDLDQEHSGKPGAGPVLVELVRQFLFDAVVARQLEALTEVGLQVGVRRCFSPAGQTRREVPVVDDQRVAGVGMVVVAPRQQHPRGQVHVTSPERREPLAANPHVLDVLGFLLREVVNGRHFLVEGQADYLIGRRIHRQALGHGVEVARLARPLLALAFVWGQLD